ncbi:hypothetical protein BV25DRAFT_1834393 [Artomyces pyxidatus]|uniref:Uncharacterized protein n=1 Tax=Artomyces pyxidatus TaxID=48021 RepID=A0ACB8TI29_9AGAM|nr:hypothetical protein BV25DRAFT_1834393 [Artomyces pyxidatus]
MDDVQIVLSAGQSPPSTVVVLAKGNAIWLHPFLFPAYVAAASALILTVRVLFSFGPLKKLREHFWSSEEEVEWPIDSDTTRTGLISAVRAHVNKFGGSTIYLFKLTRLLSVLTLLGLSIATFLQDEEGHAQPPSSLSKHWGKKHKHHKNHDDSQFTKHEWLDLALCMTYLYASFLAVLSVTATFKRAAIVTRHLSVLLLATFAIYAYRDLWPLATFTQSPIDTREGPLLWAKIAVLGFAAIVLPLTVPRKYTPYNVQEPASELNPEQTASILSLSVYAFLDPVVFLAYRISHLTHDDLPPIADYDYAKNLVGRSFKVVLNILRAVHRNPSDVTRVQHLDVFSGSPKRHLFWGFMKIFTREYIALAFLVIIKVLTGFFGPVGINRLLTYLESHGENAVVRPWVWISSLLLGPLVGTLAMQWYIFIATGMLVRVEGIITQLVFEHSLRIRMKAETPQSTATPDNRSEASVTPDSASIVEVTVVEESVGGSSDETVRANSPGVQSAASKGKQKAKAPDSKEAEPAVKDTAAKASNLVGKINNLVSTDLSNITDGRDFLFIVMYMPFQLALCIWFLYTILGWRIISAFVGMVVMIAMFPLPGTVAHFIQGVQQETMKKACTQLRRDHFNTDARVETVSETMSVLRMIKLFGWEPKIDEMVAEKRDAELKLIKKRQILNLINGNLNYVIPVITMIVTFVTYTGIMKQSLRLFDIMRDQLHSIFYMIPMFIQAKVSLDRVTDFLQNTELLDEFAGPEEEAARAMLSDASRFDQKVIGFGHASFAWSNDEPTDGTLTPSRRKFTLRIEDELLFKRGCINLIIGPTGSGKTSLLMALLGEMHFIPLGPGSWFHLPREGGVAYAAQESWVQNETIRDNILFGTPYDEARYEKVVYQCGLKRDFTLFEAGDKTEVGEKGLTLSGGQKARVTLARAIYSPAETILLDDVLAALDVHTARWIVDKCFKGDLLRGRTVLLVTHNVAMASPIADYVVSLGLDGTVASRGTVSEALAKDEILEAELEEEKEVIEQDSKEIDAEEPDATAKQADGKLILAEEVAEGHISWEALKLFFTSLGGSHVTLFWLVFLSGMVLCDIAMSTQTWFMGYWAEQYDIVDDPSQVHIGFYLTVYVLLLFVGIAVYTIGNAVYVFGSLRASRSIHRKLIQSVLGTTLRWLDTTPTSRVITRCTQDIRALDGPVANNFMWLVELSATMLIKFAAVVVLTPAFILPGILVSVLGGWCGQIYMAAQIAVKREMSNAKAPVLGHFGAAIAGLTSIRAYGSQLAFRQESYKRIDRYTRAARTFYNLNRWVSLRIDILGGLFAAALGAYLIYGPGSGKALPSDTGFSLTMAVGFSGLILWWVRVLNDFEVQGNRDSLERIQAYITIEQEPKPTKEGIPPAYWPASGDLKVENLSARYSEDGPKVLHELSFHIKSGERVGVEGTVYFDGIPTSSINLDALRTSITIIPQMPELLSGTLRENLDPFSEYDDAALNAALRAAGLFSLQADDDESRVTLDSAISSGGGNLSVGQRQILALARAIVRGSKLLILDEATSAIDYETDTIIQSSLRNELKGDVTLITVAHRLQTIMDADKIMVLDAGKIVEFDTPSELLKKEDGRLRSLVDESGDRDALYAMANRSTSMIVQGNANQASISPKHKSSPVQSSPRVLHQHLVNRPNHIVPKPIDRLLVEPILVVPEAHPQPPGERVPKQQHPAVPLARARRKRVQLDIRVHRVLVHPVKVPQHRQPQQRDRRWALDLLLCLLLWSRRRWHVRPGVARVVLARPRAALSAALHRHLAVARDEQRALRRTRALLLRHARAQPERLLVAARRGQEVWEDDVEVADREEPVRGVDARREERGAHVHRGVHHHRQRLLLARGHARPRDVADREERGRDGDAVRLALGEHALRQRGVEGHRRDDRVALGVCAARERLSALGVCAVIMRNVRTICLRASFWKSTRPTARRRRPGSSGRRSSMLAGSGELYNYPTQPSEPVRRRPPCTPLGFYERVELRLRELPADKREELVRERVERHAISDRVRGADEELVRGRRLRGRVIRRVGERLAEQRRLRGRGQLAARRGAGDDQIREAVVRQRARAVQISLDQIWGGRATPGARSWWRVARVRTIVRVCDGEAKHAHEADVIVATHIDARREQRVAHAQDRPDGAHAGPVQQAVGCIEAEVQIPARAVGRVSAAGECETHMSFTPFARDGRK